MTEYGDQISVITYGTANSLLGMLLTSVRVGISWFTATAMPPSTSATRRLRSPSQSLGTLNNKPQFGVSVPSCGY